MRRRITVAIVVMVLVTLALSGLVSLFLAQRSNNVATEHDLVREATSLSEGVRQAANGTTDPAKTLRQLLLRLRPVLSVDGYAVIGVLANGRIIGLAPVSADPALPSGLSAGDLPAGRLYAQQTVSGRAGQLVFAAVPYRANIQIGSGTRQVVRSVVQVVVLTRRPPSAFATAGPWFGLSALVILAAAGVVAWRLGRRFTAPIRAAQEVASRVAGGDLDARVPAPARTDPELADLAAAINSMTEGLSRAKAAERHFLQSVSHDLRTPLTSIRGFAEAIEDGATADAAAAAGVIASEARRLERLVGDLLALATLEARRFTLQPQVVDLSAQTAGAVAGFEPAAAEMGLHVTAQPSDPIFATADPDRLAQVLANLIENAMRYAGSGVWVGTGLAAGSTAGPGDDGGDGGDGGAGGSAGGGDGLRDRAGGGGSQGGGGQGGGGWGLPVGGPAARPLIWVSDDGPGIAPDDLPRVFDRLYSSRRFPDGARPGRPIGSGLGLTIVSELVTAMGGRIWAESPIMASGGTRMVLELPPARPVAASLTPS